MSGACRDRVAAARGLAAVVAAGVVAGRRLRPGRRRTQPSRQCGQAAPALIVPGVPPPRSPPSAGARELAASGSLALEPLGQRVPERPGRAVQPRDRALLRRLPRRRRAGVPRGEEGRARHATTRCGPTDPPPAVLPAGGYPIFEPHGPNRAARAGLAAAARRATSTRRSASTPRAARLQPGDDEAQVAAAVARFDEDNLSASFSRLGPLVAALPAQPVRSVPPRPAARLDGPARRRRSRSSGKRRRARAADRARAGGACSSRDLCRWD